MTRPVVLEAFVVDGKVVYRSTCLCGHRGDMLFDINAADRQGAKHIREAHPEEGRARA